VPRALDGEGKKCRMVWFPAKFLRTPRESGPSVATEGPCLLARRPGILPLLFLHGHHTRHATPLPNQTLRNYQITFASAPSSKLSYFLVPASLGFDRRFNIGRLLRYFSLPSGRFSSSTHTGVKSFSSIRFTNSETHSWERVFFWRSLL
jgi:hypothetical protein